MELGPMQHRPPWALLGILVAVLSAAPCPADPAAQSAAARPADAKTDEAPSDAAAKQAAQKVEALHAALLDVMKNAESLGYQGRYERLKPVVLEIFDLSFMAEKSVGRYWKTATPEERALLVDTFTRYTIANYAGRFDGWSGQSFETLREEPSARGTLLVRTRLIDPEGDDVDLDYRLRSVDGSWKIIDIYLNGTVSELALRRSEYSSLIKREGFQALLAALDERIESLAAQAPADHAS
jgi:phospholipid transport system substrate-binding protein